VIALISQLRSGSAGRPGSIRSWLDYAGRRRRGLPGAIAISVSVRDDAGRESAPRDSRGENHLHRGLSVKAANGALLLQAPFTTPHTRTPSRLSSAEDQFDHSRLQLVLASLN